MTRNQLFRRAAAVGLTVPVLGAGSALAAQSRPNKKPPQPVVDPLASGVLGVSRIWHAVVDFGFVGDNFTLNDDAWVRAGDALNGEDVSTAIIFPAGIYVTEQTHRLALSGLHFIQIIGTGGQPFFNQTPDPDMMTVFRFINPSPSVAFDLDPEQGTLQGGAWIKKVNFWNTGHEDNKAVSIDRTNNWRIDGCGFQGWGTGVYSEANIDNAHGKMIDCMMNIPAGKIGAEIVGGVNNPGAGFGIDGGSWSGDTGSIGVKGGPWSGQMSVAGDVKFDGTTHGGIVWEGSLLKVNGASFERCCDASHYAIDILHSSERGDSGRGNRVESADVVGFGDSLSVHLGPGTFSCYVGSSLYIESCASGPINESDWNIVAPQTFDMTSPPSYPLQVPDGASAAEILDALQQSQLLRA